MEVLRPVGSWGWGRGNQILLCRGSFLVSSVLWSHNLAFLCFFGATSALSVFEMEPSASCSAEGFVLIIKVSRCLSSVLFLNPIDDFNSVRGHSWQTCFFSSIFWWFKFKTPNFMKSMTSTLSQKYDCWDFFSSKPAHLLSLGGSS